MRSHQFARVLPCTNSGGPHHPTLVGHQVRLQPVMSTRGESRNVSHQYAGYLATINVYPPGVVNLFGRSPVNCVQHLVAPNSTTSADMLRPLLSPIASGTSYPKLATNGKVQTHLTVSNIRAKPPLQTDPRIRSETEKSGVPGIHVFGP